MKSKIFFLFFLFCFSLIPLVSASAGVIQANFSSYYVLGNNGVIHLDMNSFFSNYTTIDVIYNPGSILGGYGTSEIYANINGSKVCSTKLFKFCLIPSSTSVDLELTSLSDDGSVLVQVSAWDGWMFLGYVSQTFYVNSSSASVSTDTTDLSQSTSILGLFTSIFNGLFPSSSGLSTSSKFGFAFITFLIVDLLIYGLAFLTTKTINSFVHVIVLVINVALFFYLLALGYIPYVVLLVFCLIGIAVAYFKFKGGV